MNRLLFGSIALLPFMVACGDSVTCSNRGLCARGNVDDWWGTPEYEYNQGEDDIVTLENTEQLNCAHPALFDGARVRAQSCHGRAFARYLGDVHVIRDLDGRLLYVTTSMHGGGTLDAPCLPSEIAVSRFSSTCSDSDADTCRDAKPVALQFTADTAIVLGNQQSCELKVGGAEYNVTVARSFDIALKCALNQDRYHDAVFSICAAN